MGKKKGTVPEPWDSLSDEAKAPYKRQAEIVWDKYEEDVRVATDMNFVMTSSGRFVEVQGTAEAEPFTRQELLKLTELAEKGCRDLMHAQAKIVEAVFPLPKAH